MCVTGTTTMWEKSGLGWRWWDRRRTHSTKKWSHSLSWLAWKWQATSDLCTFWAQPLLLNLISQGGPGKWTSLLPTQPSTTSLAPCHTSVDDISFFWFSVLFCLHPFYPLLNAAGILAPSWTFFRAWTSHTISEALLSLAFWFSHCLSTCFLKILCCESWSSKQNCKIHQGKQIIILYIEHIAHRRCSMNNWLPNIIPIFDLNWWISRHLSERSSVPKWDLLSPLSSEAFPPLHFFPTPCFNVFFSICTLPIPDPLPKISLPPAKKLTCYASLLWTDRLLLLSAYPCYLEVEVYFSHVQNSNPSWDLPWQSLYGVFAWYLCEWNIRYKG